MRFPGLAGNSALKKRLSAGRLSHCHILEGPQTGRETLAQILAAAYECTGGGARPCGACPACKKVFSSNHPDVIEIDSDRATVPIAAIRDMQADAYIRPNEGARKVYVIPRAGDMQPPAQNALLKLLEEPPAYCAFLLLTPSADKLLETVRSRAVTLTLEPEEEADDQALLEQLKPLETAFAAGDELALYQALAALEKKKRPELLALVSALRSRLLAALADEGDPLAAAGAQALYDGAAATAEVIALLQANGSPGHAVGLLMGTLR